MNTEALQTRETKRSAFGIRTITFVALFGALSGILYLFRFPLPLMPTFFEMDFAEVPVAIGGFIFGPGAALLIIIVKILVKMVTLGSLSFGTGELQDLILCCTYILPAAFLYYRTKTRRMAIIGLTIGCVLTAVAAVFTNLYMIFPFYAALAGTTVDDLIAMCGAANPMITDAVTLALIGIIPFNLIKRGICSVITVLVYKRLSRAIKH